MPRILRSSNINQYSKICISNCGLFPKSQSSIFICFHISPPEQPSAICNLIYPVESVLFLNNPPCHSPCTSYYLHRHLTTLITMLHWTYALDICQARSFFSIHIITLLAAEASEPLFLSPISPLPLTPIHLLYTKMSYTELFFQSHQTLSSLCAFAPALCPAYLLVSEEELVRA